MNIACWRKPHEFLRSTGVLSIREVAQTVGDIHAKQDVMVNVLGGLTLVLTLGVLALLVFQIPKMFDVALRVLE